MIGNALQGMMSVWYPEEEKGKVKLPQQGGGESKWIRCLLVVTSRWVFLLKKLYFSLTGTF